MTHLPFSEDFGGLVNRHPARVVRVSTVVEIVRALELAKRDGMAVAIRGTGHSTRGQSLVEVGVMIDTSGLDHVDVDGEWVTVGAGARWDDVLRRTLDKGFTLPVLPDFLGISVGGTLSVGGVGGQSFRHGLVTSTVASMTVVSAEGQVSACSRERHPEIFDAVRAGLGLCGVIVEAKLRLVPAPERAAIVRLEYADVETLIADQLRIAADGRFDYFLGSFAVVDGSFRLVIEAVKHLLPGERARVDALVAGLDALPHRTEVREEPYFAYANRLANLPELDRARGRFHPWMDVFIPASRAAGFVGDLLGRIDPRELASGHLMTYVVARDRIDTPIVRWPDGEWLVLVDILPTFASVADAAAFSRRCAVILGRARALGGRVYPIGFPIGTEHMTADDWRDHFDWGRLSAVKRASDPSAVLNPGVGAFNRRDG